MVSRPIRQGQWNAALGMGHGIDHESLDAGGDREQDKEECQAEADRSDTETELAKGVLVEPGAQQGTRSARAVHSDAALEAEVHFGIEALEATLTQRLCLVALR